MGDDRTRVVDDQPYRHGRGRGRSRSIPRPGSGEDVEGHSLRPTDEPTLERPQRLFQDLPDSDEDDVEGHRFMGPKNAAK